MRFLFAATERASEAEHCYNRALAIQPDHVTANTNMAHLCRIQGRWEQALKHYRVASRRRPSDPRLHYYAAQMLNKRGQTEVCIFFPTGYKNSYLREQVFEVGQYGAYCQIGVNNAHRKPHLLCDHSSTRCPLTIV